MHRKPAKYLVLIDSAGELLMLATRVATKLFPESALDALPAGLSGPILTHPASIHVLQSRAPFSLAPIEGTPIEGVRRLLLRQTGDR